MDLPDNLLISIGRTFMNLLSRASLKPRRMKADLQQELDALALSLGEVKKEYEILTQVARIGGAVWSTMDSKHSGDGRGASDEAALDG